MMYERDTLKAKQARLAALSCLISSVAMVPETYLGREDAVAVIEYLCDIEYDLITQLNGDPQKPPEREGEGIEVF